MSSSAITSITYDEDSANYRCLRHCVGKAPARSELHQDWLRIDHLAIILVKALTLLIYVGVQLAKRNRHAGIGISVFIPTFHLRICDRLCFTCVDIPSRNIGVAAVNYCV